MAIYRRKDSPYFWMSFKLDGKGQVKCSTKTSDRKLALQIYHAKRAELQKFQHGFERSRVKLDDLISEYLELYSKHSKATYTFDVIIGNKLKKFFGDVYVYDITVGRIEEYRVYRLSKGVSKSTVNRECSLLKSIFNRGIEWGKCSVNPVSKIKFYDEKEFRRTKHLDENEKLKLLNACPLPTRRIVYFALFTGMRRGEILNLKWGDVDFNNNLLKVTHSKAGKIRFVNMNSELANMLKSMPKVSGYVFGTTEGKPNFTLYRKPFEKAVKEAGIQDCVFHTLRHTFASDLVMKGVDLKTVADLLGHATTTMTERYSHLSKEHKQMAVELLPKGIFYTVGVTQAFVQKAEIVKTS